MGNRRGECLDAEKRVGDDIVLAGYVMTVRRELGDVVQMFEMPW
jgi:hypothetical protein